VQSSVLPVTIKLSHLPKGKRMPTGNTRTIRLVWALVIAVAVSVCAHASDVSATTPERKIVLTVSAAAPPYEPAYQRTIRQEPKKRVVDAKFVAMSALVMGLTIGDLERTQHCLSQHTCVEMNPMLPTSRTGMYAVNIPINAGAMYLAYRLKAGGRRTWWIAPVTIAASHGVGVAFRF
jgi:hypothetical protein